MLTSCAGVLPMKTTILAFLFSAVVVLAQGPQIAITNANPVGGQHEVMPLTMTSAKTGEKVCAPYFVLMLEYKGPNNPGLMFKYSGSNSEIGLMGMMSKSKFTTILDNTKKTPTVEMVSKDGVISKDTKVLVRLSKQDYDRSRDCLPKP